MSLNQGVKVRAATSVQRGRYRSARPAAHGSWNSDCSSAFDTHITSETSFGLTLSETSAVVKIT
jgi:hypothetical protein